jgi:hypothetical protein
VAARRRFCSAGAEAAFEALHALEEGAGGLVGAGEQHAGDDDLQQETRGGGAAHLGEAVVNDAGAAGERGEAEAAGLGRHAFELVGRVVEQALVGGVADLLEHDEIAEAFEEVAGEAARVVAGLHHPVDGAERGASVGGGEGVAHLVEQGRVGDPEQRDRAAVGDALRAGTGDELVEDAQ